AARLLLHWRDHGAALAGMANILTRARARAAALMPDLAEPVRALLGRGIDTRGMVLGGPAPAPPPPPPPAPAGDSAPRGLVARTLGEDDSEAARAALVLLLRRGDEGRRRLAEAIDKKPGIVWPLHVLAALSDCKDRTVRAALKRLVLHPAAVAEARFRVGQ